MRSPAGAMRYFELKMEGRFRQNKAPDNKSGVLFCLTSFEDRF